jgi:hypothetical protein
MTIGGFVSDSRFLSGCFVLRLTRELVNRTEKGLRYAFMVLIGDRDT